MRVSGSLRRSGLSGANRPERFVSDDDPCELLIPVHEFVALRLARMTSQV